MMYHKAMKKLFKNTNNEIKPLSHKKKHQKILTDIGGHRYTEKINKGLPPIIKQTLIKKAQDKNDKIKRKLHTTNRNWNDRNSQLHWNNL